MKTPNKVSGPQACPIWLRPSCLVAGLIVAALLAAVALGTWQRVRFERAQALDMAMRTVSNLAVAYEENVTHVFDDVDRTLRLVSAEYAHESEEFDLLESWPIDTAVIKGIAVVDARDAVRFATGEGVPLPGALAAELAFQRASPREETHLGRVSRTPQGSWRLLISRPVAAPGRPYAGSVVASVDAGAFAAFFPRLGLGEQGVLSVLGRDHIALARRTGPRLAYGVDMGRSNLAALQARAPHGTFVGAARLDGIARVYAYRTLPRSGLVVQVGLSHDDALAAARERGRTYALFATLAGAMVVLVAVAVVRSVARQRRDMARIVATESQWRSSEARMRVITDAMAGGVVTTDSRGAIVSANPAAAGLLRCPRSDLPGRVIAEFVVPEERERLGRVLAELNAKTVPPSAQEYRGLRADGTTFEAEVLVSSVDLDGSRIHIGIVHDVSDRRNMERRLRASEAELRASFDQALVGIAHADLDGRFFRVNETFCAMLGYSEAEMLRLGYHDITHPEDREASVARAHAALDRGADAPQAAAKRYLRKDGSTLWGLMSLTVVRDEHGKPRHFAGMVQDITEIKRAERMKNEFVSTVSHELRTPLTSINGSLGLLAAGVTGTLPAPARSLVEIATRNCARLIRLVNDILDTDKLASGGMVFTMRRAELGPLLARVVEANAGVAGEMGVRLRLGRPREPIFADVDPDRFEQLVTNLISNAVKFSPREGAVEILLEREDGHAHVAVRDHGPGIPAEFRARIFERFSQADGSDTRGKGGTGLGLHIARAIAERLDATLGFETALGEGTTFHVRLPLAPERAAPSRDTPAVKEMAAHVA